MSSSIVVPKLRWPLAVSHGQFEVVEQDSTDEIIQCVGAICRTPIGARETEPEFGVPDQTFNPSLDDLIAAVDEWEPRAAVELDSELLEETVLEVNLEVSSDA